MRRSFQLLSKNRLPEIVKKNPKTIYGKTFESKELEDALKLEQKILVELNRSNR
jgi:hypothetical protein